MPEISQAAEHLPIHPVVPAQQAMARPDWQIDDVGEHRTVPNIK